MRGSHSGEAVRLGGETDEYKQDTLSDHKPTNLNSRLRHPSFNHPSLSATTSTSFTSEASEKDHWEGAPCVVDSLERDQLLRMSSAGFSPGGGGIGKPKLIPHGLTAVHQLHADILCIGPGHGTKIHSHPNLFPQGVQSHPSLVSPGPQSYPDLFPKRNNNPSEVVISKPLTSINEPLNKVKRKTIESYFIRPKSEQLHLAAKNSKTANLAQTMQSGQIHPVTKEVIDPNPLTLHKARDVIDGRDESTPTVQSHGDKPQSTHDTAKNVITSEPLSTTAKPLEPFREMGVTETAHQCDGNQEPNGASNRPQNRKPSTLVHKPSNVIGEKNVRRDLPEDVDTDTTSLDGKHAGVSIIGTPDRKVQTGFTSSSRGPPRRSTLNASPQLYVNKDVPVDYATGDWDSTDGGFATKPWSPSILGPRIDYNILPRYNFGKPLKKQGVLLSVPVENENDPSEVEKNAQTGSHNIQNAMNEIDASANGNTTDDKHLPPHLRTPAKNQAAVTPKENGTNKPASKNVEEQHRYLPPHLRTPGSSSPVAQSEPKMRSIAEGGHMKTPDQPSRAGMLKDITNTPRPTRTAQNKIGNHTEADPNPYKESPLSDANNVTTKASELSGATPVPNKAKGKAIALEAPIAGWHGQMPLGPPKWDNEALYDNNDKRQRKHMQEWLAKNVDEAVDNPIKVDVEKAGFMTGDALADGQEELSGPVDPELHKTYLPDDPFTVARAHETAEDKAQDYQKRLREQVIESKEERRMWRRLAKEREANFVAPPNPHKPKANIYIRPAEGRDMAQITEIYNYYIRNAVTASERQDLTVPQWRGRWQGAIDDSYAFIVAVQMSGKGPGLNRRQANEVVVGFAYAEDYGDNNNAYRFTCEIQFWVHHAYPRVGVGKTLVDRMLFALDPDYPPRSGTTFVGGEDEIKYMWGGRRIIKKILINIPYPAEDDYNLKWQAKWLVGFDFFHVCTLPGIGYKFGKL